MILVFHITDSAGHMHRFSAVCGPATTAVGAINKLRSMLSIPTEVDVKLHLTNDVPIRHLTAPLTSLRKQHSGSAQAVCMPLWAVLSGPEATIKEIDFSPADVTDQNDEEKENKGEEASRSLSHTSPRPCSSTMERTTNGSQSTHIVFSAPPPKMPPVPVQAKMPAAAASPRPYHKITTRVHEAPETTDDGKIDPLETGDAQKNVFSTSNLATTSSAAGPSLVIKRRSICEATASVAQMHFSSRGPVRRPSRGVAPPSPDMPQTARTAPRQLAVSGLDSYAGADPADRAGGLYKTGYARRDTVVGHIMLREYPKVISRDPKQIVLAVKDDERLASRTHNRDFFCASDIDGVDDTTYAQCLSIGLIHGQKLGASTSPAESRLALYGELGTLRHSCWPNAAVQYDLSTAPYPGICRCARLEGIRRGEEITYLYKHADSLAFLLLSRERRRNILERKYFLDCDCCRCTETLENTASTTVTGSTTAAAGAASVCTPNEKGSAPNVRPEKSATRTKAQLEAELTLTVAFFTDSGVDRDAVKQRELREEMHKDFESLQIMDDTGVEINLTLVGNIPPIHRMNQCNRLLAFLRKYGSSESVLRLHDHHWRLNLVRAAYVQETVRLCAVKGATPDARQRDPNSKTLFVPTKTVYDISLKQLAAEALFIPPGHPQSLTTYESYLYLLAILPPAIAQTAAYSAQSESNIKWKQLQETKEVWGVLKRAALPPNIHRLVQPKIPGQLPSPQEWASPPAPEPLVLVEQESVLQETSMKALQVPPK
ncbi:conserved hypothetical protein [Leishmania mexicana MHOM/GT/2001/U1103]|uniref:SET domain-containing protein n=1 Tax=Leishmania mexicana (strain MHOM/GT/2001/U1103) TaxID=929439 RepID=E9B6F1_LEIMU|nr:conserved hypothetical protein [Leishmania mexicana MHOM/GT/2001/U1103]CBZ30823.1 conserved hypothetical protein [Leishmania mexicana MHOM/GT/2001/U1103]